MYFQDLSPYRYAEGKHKYDVLNVGWLDIEHPFPKAKASEELLDALFEKCLHSVNRTRGYHLCEFCPVASFGIAVSRKDKSLILGSAEIWIKAADGKTYAAPNLIYHYVAEHNYEPPKEFIIALFQ